MTRYYWCDDKTKEKIEEEESQEESGVTPVIFMGGPEASPPAICWVLNC